MDIILLSIGTELLKGRTLNTNAHYMAARLYTSGFDVIESRTISDQEKIILSNLEECFQKADIVISTGGLGPTRDDITKAAACRFFDRELVFDENLFKKLEELFFKIGYKEFPERSRNQALVPEGAFVMPNSRGTAPGLVIEEKGKMLILLPGVPVEMKALLEEQVLPFLASRYPGTKPESAVVRTIGLGESLIAERIEEGLNEEEKSLLNYYPHGGFVDVVIAETGSCGGTSRETIARVADHVAKVVEGHVYTREEKSLLEVIAGILISERKKLAVAESCTGGLLAKNITDIPGSSSWFAGGVVSYSNKSKTYFLDVPETLLEKYGAVSAETAESMAEGILKKCGTDYALAITGIAGPGGGSELKPVGTVYIAIAQQESAKAEKYNFTGDRSQIRQRSVIKACELLWRFLKENLHY